MITGSTNIVQSADWQQQLANGFRRPLELLSALAIEPASVADLDLTPDFPQRVPREFASRMVHGNPEDPLLLQVLPVLSERAVVSGYTSDPLEEAAASRQPGIIHKYHGRVLLITTGACAVHCRYCFRRHFPYQDHHRSREQWSESLAYVNGNPTISEVILSGGDPLLLSDARLSALISGLEAIPHLRRLRIHTRLPIVLPQRITPQLIEILSTTRLRCSVVIHCNHPNEIDTAVTAAIDGLTHSGATLFNQTVLLRRINDRADTLAELSESLFDAGVIPYYLHLLDPVAGSAHFDLPEHKSKLIYRELLELLPGYLVPKLVRETPAHAFKTPVTPC